MGYLADPWAVGPDDQGRGGGLGRFLGYFPLVDRVCRSLVKTATAPLK